MSRDTFVVFLFQFSASVGASINDTAHNSLIFMSVEPGRMWRTVVACLMVRPHSLQPICRANI